MTADPEALVPLVRNAGAVFCGACAPAVVGDYVAGVNHVLPTGRTARFASALAGRRLPEARARRRRRRGRAAQGRAAHPSARRGRGPARARRARRRCASRGHDAPEAASRTSARSRATTRPSSTSRAAQHEREPVPASARSSWRRGSTRCAQVPLHRYPDREARRAPIRARGDDGPARNAGALRQRIERGAPDPPAHVRRRGPARARVRADVRAALAHRPDHGDRGRDGGADRRLHGVADRGRDADRRRATGGRVPLQPEQPDRHGRVARDRRGAAGAVIDHGPGLLVVDEAYGEFADWSALELVGDDVPLVVVRTYSKVWSLAALRLGFAVGPAAVVAELEKVVLPYHLSAPTQLAGIEALRFDDEMRERVQHARGGARPAGRRARPAAAA